MSKLTNNFTLIGNLAINPEPLSKGGCALRVAVNGVKQGQDGKPEDTVDFHRIVVWGKQAEVCLKYLTTGRKVGVEGHLATRRIESNEKVYNVVELVTENVVFLDSPKKTPPPLPNAAE